MPDQIEYATLKTVVGPKQIPVPKTLKDETSLSAWARLLNLTRNLELGGSVTGSWVTPHKTKKARAYDEAQAYAYALVLADNNGMSPFYWQQEAKKLYHL